MKKIDIFMLILFPTLALLVSFLYKTNLLISDILFFGLPSLYLAFRNHGIFLKSLMFAFVFSLALCPFFDALGYLDKAWVIPYTVFSFKFFGVSTVENYLFGFLWVLFTILFYEHFFDKGKWKDRISKNMRYLWGIAIFLLSLLIFFYFYNFEMLTIPYFYLWASLIFVLPPLVAFLYFYPKFLKNFVLIGLYFSVLLLLFEIGALHNNQWIFPGSHFIGFVDLFGYRFPVEEFIFWMIFCTPSLICYYEFFADDRK